MRLQLSGRETAYAHLQAQASAEAEARLRLLAAVDAFAAVQKQRELERTALKRSLKVL